MKYEGRRDTEGQGVRCTAGGVQGGAVHSGRGSRDVLPIADAWGTVRVPATSNVSGQYVSGSSSVYSVVGFLPFLRSRATIVIIHVRRVCLAHLKLHGQGDRGGMGVGAAVMRMST
jgi:hypothetical protein